MPKSCLDFTARYPIAINARLSDIREASHSRNRVLPGDGFEGPVIVKTALNAAGIPERQLA